MGNSLYFSIKGGVLTRLDSETEIRPGTVLRFSFEDNWGAGAKSFALFRSAADGTYYGQALVNNMCTIPVCMVERAKFFVSVSTGIEETNPVEIRNRAVEGPVTAEELREMMKKLNEAGSAADAVRYSAQEVTDAQKEQARTNIGAAAVGEGGGGGLVVTVDNNVPSKSSAEIAAHVKDGGNVVLKRGEDFYSFINYSEDTGAAYFIQVDPMDGEYFQTATVDGNRVYFHVLPFALNKEVVKTVNGVEPDESGNVDVDGASMIVTVTGTTASHRDSEIKAHVKAGGTVVLQRGEDLYNFINYSEDAGAACFIEVDAMEGEYIEIVYVSGNKVFSYMMPFALESEVVKITEQTLPATQQAAARENIGAAPVLHVDNSGEYGKATFSLYGHVRLMDGANENQNTDGGFAATPYALWKETKDLVSFESQELTDPQKEQARANIGAAAVGEGEKNVTPDLDAAEGEDGHIKHRTHWREWEYTDITKEESKTMGEGSAAFQSIAQVYKDIVEGGRYRVTWDGVAYDCVCKKINEKFYIGDASIPIDGVAGTGEPFCVITTGSSTATVADSEKFLAGKGGTVTRTYKIAAGTPVYHKLPEEFLPDVAVRATGQQFTEEQKAQARANVGAAGTEDLTSHNTNTGAHADLRTELKALSDRINAALDSDDTTLDELSEIVAYIKSNKGLIDAITVSKVNVSDIADNLVTNVANKPLSAAQGVALKALVDAVSASLANYQPKGNYLTRFTETDPTVPSWAKQSSKPAYNKSEVGLGNVDNVKQYSADNPPPYPVTSVNGKTGDVKLDAAAVGARPANWMPSAADVGALPASTVVPTKVSQLANDAGYLTELSKEEIVQQVLAALGTPVFGRVDGNNNIILTGELADGKTYTFAYIDDDGNRNVIGTYTKEAAPTYTNVIPTSIGYDGTVLNGVGYMDGYRLTGNQTVASNLSYLSAKSGYFATGFFPYTIAQCQSCVPFYVKGVNLDSLSGDERMSMYSNEKSSVYSENLKLNVADNKGVTIEKLGDLYYKITPNGAAYTTGHPNGWSANNATMARLSFPGSGAGVILTINEPIE